MSGFQQMPGASSASAGNAAHSSINMHREPSEGAPNKSTHNGTNGAEESRPPPKKRNRLALSCVSCRERKIKCNREVPCDQCTKRGDAHLCRHEPFKHKAAEAREHPGREAVGAGGSPRESIGQSSFQYQTSSGQSSPVQLSSAAPHAANVNASAAPKPARTNSSGRKSAASSGGMGKSASATSLADSSTSSLLSRHPTMTTSALMLSTEQQEMQAIKTRLAQLEAMLQAKASGAGAGSVTSGSPTGTTYTDSPRSVHAGVSNGVSAAAQYPAPSLTRNDSTSAAVPYVYSVNNYASTAKSPVSQLTGSIYSAGASDAAMSDSAPPSASNFNTSAAASDRSLPSLNSLLLGRNGSGSSASGAVNDGRGTPGAAGSAMNDTSFFDTSLRGGEKRPNASMSAQQQASTTNGNSSASSANSTANGSATNSGNGPKYVQLPNGHVRMDIDSDTEDAALVLEGLAMGGRDSKISVSRLVNAAEGCPSLKGQGAGDAGSMEAQAGIAGADASAASAGNGPGSADPSAGKGKCPKEFGQTDILDPGRIGKFESALDQDKKVDLMLPVAEGGTSRVGDEAYVPRPSGLALSGWQEMRKKLGDKMHSAGGPTQEEGDANVAEMRQGGDKQSEDSDMHDASVQDRAKVAGSSDAAAEEDADGCGNTGAKENTACGAQTNMCKLACENDGLFRLKQGPETLLGWGMGWSWGAAEAKGDYRTIKGSVCPGSAEREAVLRAIIRTLPNKEIASQLVDVYASRVYYLTGHIVHIPTLLREMDAFYSFDSVEKQARVLNYVDPAWLSMFLMILVLGLQFYPCYPPEHYINIQNLFDGKTIHLWYSAHKTILILARYQCSQSIAVLQAILLADLHGAEHERTSASLLRIAITNAQEMGLHRLGDKSRQPQPDEAPGTTILREMYKRIWWSLVWRDWGTSMKNGGVYTIHPGQFNTPYPGNYNDEDLCQTPLPPPRPQPEHTEMSFVLSKLMIADAVRENTDLLNQRDFEGNRDGSSRHLTCQDTSRLDARYRAILENAPSFFRVGSDAGAGTDIEVQRWLLQQGVFSKLLRLHRVGLSSKTKSRTSCVLLARSILDMQKKLRSRCTVVDRLWFILAQSFSAAVVLCLDLFSTPSPPAMREIIRSEIGEALDSLRLVESTNPNVSRSIRILEALLAEEEAQWKRRGSGGNSFTSEIASSSKRKRDEAEEGQKRKQVLSLALRVKRAVEGNPLPEDSEAGAVGASGSSDGMGHKDEFVKELMGQILKPQLNDDGSQVAFPYLVSSTQTYPSEVPSIAPNGVVALPNTPPDGRPFDLANFLAQYGGSPTSASDDMQSLLSSNHSSASRSPVDSTASSRSVQASSSSTDLTSSTSIMSHPSRQGSADEGKRAQQNFVGQDSANPTTGLDSFWDWIFSQGGGQNQQQFVPSQPVPANTGGNATLAQGPSSQAASQGGATATLPAAAPTPESYFAQVPGGAPVLNGSLLPTPLPVSQPEGPMTPSKAAGVTGFEGYNDPYGINQSQDGAPVKTGTPFSVGTPSSGWDSWFATSLESFMQT